VCPLRSLQNARYSCVSPRSCRPLGPPCRGPSFVVPPCRIPPFMSIIILYCFVASAQLPSIMPYVSVQSKPSLFGRLFIPNKLLVINGDLTRSPCTASSAAGLFVVACFVVPGTSFYESILTYKIPYLYLHGTSTTPSPPLNLIQAKPRV
jgi:hypothetical protein